MSQSENRRFPRIDHVSSKQIIHVDSLQNPQKNLILTENLSASGIKFTTNTSLQVGLFFLIYLNDQLMHEIRKKFQDQTHWIRAGDYYLTKVVRLKTLDEKENMFEVGAAFIEKDGCCMEDLEIFTELMNISMLHKLPASIRSVMTATKPNL